MLWCVNFVSSFWEVVFVHTPVFSGGPLVVFAFWDAFSAAFATILEICVSRLGILHSSLHASLGVAKNCPVMHLSTLFIDLSSLSANQFQTNKVGRGE